MTAKKAKTLVNAQTENSVEEFIENVDNQVRKADSRTILQVISEITGDEPRMWGKSIVGFGKYTYQRKNGDEFEWFNVGFSPGKAHLTVYVMFDLTQSGKLLKDLGPHKTGKGCLYIKKLEDTNMDVLKKVIAKSDRWDAAS